MISIMTPTYNRQHTLKRLYDSLCSQDCLNFEWVIVDDGSVDESRILIDTFISENKIRINYLYQQNKGKPGAINTGLPLCQFDYIFIVDSDDALTNDAVSSLIAEIVEAEKTQISFSGVGFRRATFEGSIWGVPPNFKEPIIYLSATEASGVFQADLAYCFKKWSMLQHPFPFYKNERFIPELYIWNKITDEGKIRFNANKVIYLAEFLDDGLTKNFKKQLKKYPYSFRVFYADQFFRETKIIKKIKMMIRFFQCFIYEKMK
ncbi:MULTISPECIES: glycosyltransferase family A protein [Citrobacter]|uniref:glycosyltransferase family A protein n=1 Tax=Citrobacter TaxID=544 RepID=UPI00214DC2E2|nr:MULTISPECIES: glycosyltransferase family A protein [Citrobacter]MCR3695379.1 glycosyltransferase family 2 protein [Citrobacter portucalensis]MDM2902440.1 glycosyltransferase family 2 protein [Citrobacter sp. Cpo037]